MVRKSTEKARPDPWITSIVTCSKPHQDVPVIDCYPGSEWPRICWIVALKLSWHVGILNYLKASKVWGDELFLYPGQIYHNLRRTYDSKLYFIYAGTSKNVLDSDWWITELPWFKMLYFELNHRGQQFLVRSCVMNSSEPYSGSEDLVIFVPRVLPWVISK